MSQTTCVFCHNAKDDDWYLCGHCQKSAVRWLREIPKLHEALAADDWLKMPERAEAERPQRSATRGAPANLHVLVLLDKRTDVRAVFRSWVEEIHDRLNTDTKPPTDVRGLSDRLIELMPWAASNHPAVGDLVFEIREQHTALDRVVTGSRKPPKPVRCPVVLPEKGECEGTLTLHRDGSVSCRACDSVWQFEDWQRLGALLAT